MDSSNFRRKKFIEKSTWPSRKGKSEKDDEEWNDISSHEDFNVEDNQLPLESIPEPEYDEEEVFLSWYDSDLNLIIDDNFIAASPLHQGGFSYLQAGARATFGFFSGKVCFEVKVLQCCKLGHTKGHLNTHLLRVGWSPRKASLGLGSDHKSYGYDSTGRVSTLGEIVDYGKIFSTGDVVGAYLDIGAEKITISFTVNGDDMGVAYDIPQSVVQKEPLFPHVLTKNISYECNFGKEKPWFPPKEGYTFVANVEKEHRIAGPRRPKSQSDCEVILMVGLPKSGKTTWVNEFREKNPGMYYVVDSNVLIDNMELMNPKREAIILRNTRVLGKLLGIAMDRRRNYILDQYNVVRAEQVWKLGFFRNYKRRIVSVVLPDMELKKRNKTFNEDPPWMLKLKAKYLLPMMSCPKISAVADKVEYVGLQLKDALPLIKKYNRDAWREGFMPYKNFRVPAQMYKDKMPNTKGDWMPQGMVDPMETDFHGGGGWNSPPRARGGGEWHPPPPQNRGGEEWQPPPPRERMGGGWCSPSRQRAGDDWHPPPPRGRSPGAWPPGGPSRTPFKEGMDGGWPPGGMRKRRLSESPPRKRAGSRWGPPVEELPPPRSRMEDWQARRGRSPGRFPRLSPPRGRPDAGASFPGRRSPPGSRTEEFFAEKERFRVEGPGGWRPNEGWEPMQGNPGHENWIGTGQERVGKFPPQETRGRRGGFPPEMQMEGNFPPEQRGDGGMRHFEIRVSNLPPQEVILGESFHHRGGVRGGRSMSPPQRMENEFPLEEARFSRHLSLKKERIDDPLHPHERRIDPDFSTRNPLHLGGTFPRKEGGFPPQDGQFGAEHVPFGERGNMPPLEGRMGRGFSPPGRRGNNFPPPERRMMGGGLSIRDRLGEKLDDMPPRVVRRSRSLSPRERIRGNLMPPNEERMHHDMMPLQSRMSDLPLRGGRIDEMSPHMGRMREDRTVLIGRTGGHSLPRENIVGGPHGGRIMDNFPPQEHRVGDLPPRDGRMGGGFAARGPGDNLPPHGNRRGGDLAHQEHGPGYPFPHHERHGANLPSREGRLDGDLPPPERMSADYPFHEGRMGRGDLQRGRGIDDVPYGGRMSGDMPIGGGIGGDGPSHRGRPINEMPFHGNRGGSNDFPHEGKVGEFPPNRGRIEIDLPLGGRVGGGDFLPGEGKIIGDLPSGARIGNEFPSSRGRVGGAGSPPRGRHGGDLPPHQDRRGGDMPPPGGKACGDLPLFVGRHDEFPSHRGKPGGDMPHHGRPGGDMPPDGRRYGGHLPPHGARFDDKLPSVEGKFGGDMPPHGGRIGDDVPPYGGDISREVGMPGDLREGRSSSRDRWNRLPEKDEGPRKFTWMGDQESSPNKGNIKREPGHLDLKREPGHLQHHPAGRREGGGPPGDWKPLDDRMQDGTSPMQQLHHLDNRNRENNANRFHDKKQVSPNRASHKWTSPSGVRRPGSPSPNRLRRQSLSPPARSRMEQHARKQEIEQPGDRRLSPRGPMVGQRSPMGRSDRFSPEGRRVIRQQSPGRGGGDNWGPPGGRHSGEWQPLDRGNHGGEGDRLPPNMDRSHHSPPRKQQRMEPDAGHRPNRPFPDGPDGRDSHGAGFPPIGNIDQMHEPTGRDLRDRILSSKEQHGPPFHPSSQLGTLGPCGSGEQFLGGPVNESGPGWQKPHRGPPREGWQSPGNEGGGSQWERMPEEEDELAPYEIPFNQADWDSNDPHAGISQSESGYQPEMKREDTTDERNRGNEGNRNQEAAGHPGSKARGSVWQRVGGYVDDKKDSRERRGPSRERRGPSRERPGPPRERPGPPRERHGPSHYIGHVSSSGRGERGYRGGRDDKERNRGFEETRVRRGRY